MDRDEIVQLIEEMIKDGLTIEMDSERDWEGDRAYITVKAKVIFNNKVIASDSTSFSAG